MGMVTALTQLGRPGHRRHRNRAENLHRATRRPERQMQRFKSPTQAQGFLSAHSFIFGHLRPRRHRLTARVHRTAPGLRRSISGSRRVAPGTPHDRGDICAVQAWWAVLQSSSTSASGDNQDGCHHPDCRATGGQRPVTIDGKTLRRSFNNVLDRRVTRSRANWARNVGAVTRLASPDTRQKPTMITMVGLKSLVNSNEQTRVTPRER